MSKLLSEATSVPVASKDGRWKSILITPGEGSSGTWTESVLRERGPAVLKKGAKSFVTHNRTENGEPDPFSMWGYLAEDSYYEEGVGLVGEIEVLPSWRDRVEEVAPHTALSVYLMGESDENGVIVDLYEDVQNGVDLVVHPGRPGSGLVEKLYESAMRGKTVEESSTASVEVHNDEEGLSKMAEKDVLDALAKLTVAVEAMTESKQEQVRAEADSAAVATEAAKRVEAYDAAISVIEAADILPSQKQALRESAKRGEDIAQAVESAKAIAAEAREAFASQGEGETGRLGEAATATKFGAWS